MRAVRLRLPTEDERMGDNGAGKSTLVKTIMGVHPPDAGTIEIEGRRQAVSHPDHARHLGIEAIYQDLALVGTFDLGDNFFLGREFMRSFATRAMSPAPRSSR